MKTNNTTKFKSWELRDTTVDTESVLTCRYIANFIPVLKIERIRAVFEFIKNLGPVVRRPISAYPGLNFNPGLFFVSSKAFSWTIFSIIFRVANHQMIKRTNLNLLFKLSHLNSNFELHWVILTQLWTTRRWRKNSLWINLRPVHTYPDIFESATCSFRVKKFPRSHVSIFKSNLPVHTYLDSP